MQFYTVCLMPLIAVIPFKSFCICPSCGQRNLSYHGSSLMSTRNCIYFICIWYNSFHNFQLI